MQDAKSKRRNKALGALITFILTVSIIGVCITFPRAANAASLASTRSTTSSAAGGSGATLPYVEMEAHNATTNGTVMGPDYQLGDLASDGVDRTIVQLTH